MSSSTNKIEFLLTIPLLLSLYIVWGDITSGGYNNWLGRGAFAVSILCIFGEILIFLKKQFDKKLNNKEIEIRQQKRKFESEIKEKERVIEKKVNQNKALANLIKSKTPFSDVAKMSADFETCIFEKEEHYLRYKPHPAYKAADRLQILKKELLEKTEEYNIMLYKYDFLLGIFPDLKYYVEDDEALIHISNYGSLNEFNDKRDRVRDWLSDEEYRNLPIDDRNQRALDRYKSRPKSNWEVGIEYELYIGYLLREGKNPFDSRFAVIQYGEIHGLSDLGRDIIAERNDENGNRVIYIIQCKRWSEHKYIHENSICQLFGTTIEYKLRNKGMRNSTILPVFITTTELSDMAKQFAKQLGVWVIKVPMGEYPMIKCNINNGEKIYHLPFDQQYHNTMIKNDGEFYAMTVKDATAKGFRRAMRHFL